MLLLPETVARQNGMGAEIAIDAGIVRLTLGITRIISQESLTVSVSGSSDGQHWRPLAVFPQKFYCGTYTMVLDLTRHRNVKYLRAEWKMDRWNPDEREPLFGFYLLAGELSEVAANAAG